MRLSQLPVELQPGNCRNQSDENLFMRIRRDKRRQARMVSRFNMIWKVGRAMKLVLGYRYTNFLFDSAEFPIFCGPPFVVTTTAEQDATQDNRTYTLT